MIKNYALQAGIFVDFLNSEFSDDLKKIAESPFELKDLRPFNLFGVGRQKIVLNNMYSPFATSFYGRNIERMVNILHSKGKTRHFSLASSRAEKWKRMGIDVVKPIELGHSKVIEPQNLILHQISTMVKDIAYLEQVRGPEQLTYENGVWRYNY